MIIIRIFMNRNRIYNRSQYVKGKRTFRVETYYKSYSDLVKYPDDDPIKLTNEGTGAAKGLELFWRDNGSINRLDYWISYSYLDTKRNYLDFPYEAHTYIRIQTQCVHRCKILCSKN